MNRQEDAIIRTDIDGNPSVPHALRQASQMLAPSSFVFHAFTTMIGFVTGSVVVIPVVLWLTGYLGGTSVLQSLPASPSPAAGVREASRSTDVFTVGAQAAAPAVAPILVSAPRPAQRPLVASDAVQDVVRVKQQEQFEAARSLIRQGDIEAARGVLEAPDIVDQPDAMFLMAETFDPNVHAVLGVKPGHADAAQARHHYERAVAAGIAEARRRLENLK